jgi:hypothetical protein
MSDDLFYAACERRAKAYMGHMLDIGDLFSKYCGRKLNQQEFLAEADVLRMKIEEQISKEIKESLTPKGNNTC